MRSLTELALSYEDTRQFLRGHICACGGQLVLATRPARGDNPPHHLVSEYVIKCGTDPEHGSYRAIGSSTLNIPYDLRIGDTMLCACGRMLQVGDTAYMGSDNSAVGQRLIAVTGCNYCKDGNYHD